MIQIDLKNNPEELKIIGSQIEVSAEISFLLECLYDRLITITKLDKNNARNFLTSMVDIAIGRVQEIENGE